MKRLAVVAGACAAFACVAVGFLLTLTHKAHSQPYDPAAEVARPDDLERWVTVGVTVRLDRQDHATPSQMRQVLMPAEDYERFVQTRSLADGTRLAVLFHPVVLDASHQPPLYHARAQEALALEVIDRTHADGRRFYTFAPETTRATARLPGNECAVCHNARGSFEGTFAHMYPVLAQRLGEAR
jgi:hypothetical protein